MRIFFWFMVSGAVLLLVNQGVAQDSLDYNPLTLTPATTADPFIPAKWRLSGSLGYHRLVQKGYLNENLYLTNGFQATMATDYFVGRYWGLGVSVGYQNLAVSDLYQRDPVIPKSPVPRILPLTSQHSFMLTVGPAFSFPLSPRLLFDVDLRGGLFYNDAPVLGAYTNSYTQDNLLNGILVSTIVIPSADRFRAGFNGSAGIKYQLTPQLSTGLSANASLSSFEYTQVGTTGNFNQKRVDLTTFGVQVAVSYRFLSSQSPRQRISSAPAVTPKPTCYPPILDPTQRDTYVVGAAVTPVFKWRSSAPIYTEGERYLFRLFTLPGNKLVYEKTVSESQLIWPSQLPLPDSASAYFYSITTTRIDNLEQTCLSEPVVGAISFYRRNLAGATPVARESAPLFTLTLYELSLGRVARTSPQATKSVKRPLSSGRSRKTPTAKVVRPLAAPANVDSIRTDSVQAASSRADSIQVAAIRSDSARLDAARPDSMRADTVRSDSIRSDSIRTTHVRSDSVRAALSRADSIRATTIRADSIRTATAPAPIGIVFRLLYEGPTRELDFTWPADAPLPAQPTVYQYIISRNSNRQIVQNHYLIVEPDGCSTIISEATKNRHLQYNNPLRPSVMNALPANKGKP